MNRLKGCPSPIFEHIAATRFGANLSRKEGHVERNMNNCWLRQGFKRKQRFFNVSLERLNVVFCFVFINEREGGCAFSFAFFVFVFYLSFQSFWNLLRIRF
jgi:hypothetical protein